MSQNILTKQENGILFIEMNRPEKKNALTTDMYQAMADCLHEGDSNDDVRCFVISGTPGCFTSGNDVQDFLKNPPSSESSPVIAFLQALVHTQKPIVAAVSGLAVGIGTTMLLHCDLVFADKEARFQMPFVNLGLCPEAASSLILGQMVGHQKAAELLLLGEMFDVHHAAEFGFVNQVAECAYVKASEIAHTLAQKPPNALKISKQLLKADRTPQVVKAMQRENKAFMQLLVGAEAKEAFTAFVEKRQPDWSRC